MDLASMLSGLAFALAPLAVTLLLLIFPDGRLLSRRWWAVVGMAVGGPLFGALTEPFSAYSDAAEVAATVAISVSLGALLASVVAVVLRWRRSRDRERQQIKLVVYAVAATVAAILSAVVSTYVMGDIPGAETYPTVLAWVVSLGGIALGIPVAIGVAILKYHLYDIDLVINRTLVYGVLTAVLALIYFGGVTATQAISRSLTGQEEQPQLVIVTSTLVIAALFNPLRRRIQAFIDRRFYRRKYDAAKTLEAFSAKLRDETDLDALTGELIGVVGETMQPAHVSLWLRPELPPRGSEGQE
jgi:MFS family permease